MFVFVPTKYNAEAFIAQVGRVLEKRGELDARINCPKLWKLVEPKGKSHEERKERERRRHRAEGIFLIILGALLIIPYLLYPKSMLISLSIGAFLVSSGLIKLWLAKKAKKIKFRYVKEAMELFNYYEEKIPQGKALMTFSEDKIQFLDKESFGYSDIQTICFTEDFFVVFWKKQTNTMEQLAVLQKKDISQEELGRFINFIIAKTDNSSKVAKAN